jgi:hypothetical protein
MDEVQHFEVKHFVNVDLGYCCHFTPVHLICKKKVGFIIIMLAFIATINIQQQRFKKRIQLSISMLYLENSFV